MKEYNSTVISFRLKPDVIKFMNHASNKMRLERQEEQINLTEVIKTHTLDYCEELKLKYPDLAKEIFEETGE